MQIYCEICCVDTTWKTANFTFLRWNLQIEIYNTVSTHQIWPPNFSYFCQIWPRLVKFQISNLTSSGKICLERSNLKFHFWPPNFKFDLLQKTGSRVHHTQKITINKIYHAWTQKSNLMLNLGQIFAKFYLAKFARAGSNLAKINLMRGHSTNRNLIYG